MSIFTIGFTGKSAETFFSILKESGAKRVVDIRINRTSQLAGFAKEQDMSYFLNKLSNMNYLINTDLAPTKDLLTKYRDKEISWEKYAQEYISLIHTRKIIESLGIGYFENSVFMCSEREAEQCHRKLLTDLLLEQFPQGEIIHL
jgi:uncharacterized protein (DUF488 family)